MKPRTELSIFLAILILSTGLHFSNLGKESIWGDELYSLALAGKNDFGTIARMTAADAHPPLYYFLLRIWCSIFGLTLVSIRAFSAAVSFLTLPLFWRLARKMIGQVPGIIATLFMGLSPYQLYYAQEARMYSLLVLSEVLIILCLIVYLDSPSRLLRVLAVMGLFASTAMAIFTHFFFIFIVIFVAVYWIIRLVVFSRAYGTERFANGLPATEVAGYCRSVPNGTQTSDGLIVHPQTRLKSVAAFVAWCAWVIGLSIPGFLQMLDRARTGQGIDWIPPLSFQTFKCMALAFTYGIFIMPKPLWIIFPLLAAFAVAIVSAFRPAASESHPAQRPDPCWIVLLFFSCTLLLPVLVSIHRPIVFFGQRYEIIATPPFYMLAGLGLFRLKSRINGALGAWVSGMLLVTILGGWLWYTRDYFNSRHKRPYDAVARELDEHFQEGDAMVVFPPTIEGCVSFYLKNPFEFLPLDQPRIYSVLDSRPNCTIWFVSIAAQLSPVESNVALRTTPLMTRRFEVADRPQIPEQLQFVRAYAYKNDRGTKK